MRELIQQYLAEAQQSGFIIDANVDTPLVAVDRSTFMHIIFDDPQAEEEGMYYVSRWYKQTPDKKGDYSGCPDFEGTLVECLTYVRDWKPL